MKNLGAVSADKDFATKEYVDSKSSGGGGSMPTITATAAANTLLVCTNGVEQYTRLSVTANEPIVFDLPSFGMWTVYIASSFANVGKTTTCGKTIHVRECKNYTVNLNGQTGAGYRIYGAYWDGGADPKWTRTDTAIFYNDPTPYVKGATEYGSQFDSVSPWSGLTKSEDENAGTVVAIPKYYYKWTKYHDGMWLQISRYQHEGFLCSPAHADRGDGAGERATVYVGRYHSIAGYKSATGANALANITRAAARAGISALGDNVWQYDFAMYWTIMMLYLVEYANWNSQGVIGQGCGDGSLKANGLSDEMPYHTGTMQADRSTAGQGVQYRNIEGLWDGVFDWVDGIYFDKTDVYNIKNPAQFSDTEGGTLTGTRPTGSNYIVAWDIPTAEGFEYALYPSKVSNKASGTTFGCDYCYCGWSGVVLCAGGDWYDYDDYGAFCLSGYLQASDADSGIGARVQVLPS